MTPVQDLNRAAADLLRLQPVLRDEIQSEGRVCPSRRYDRLGRRRGRVQGALQVQAKCLAHAKYDVSIALSVLVANLSEVRLPLHLAKGRGLA